MYVLEDDPRFSRLEFEFTQSSFDHVLVEDSAAQPHQEA